MKYTIILLLLILNSACSTFDSLNRALYDASAFVCAGPLRSEPLQFECSKQLYVNRLHHD